MEIINDIFILITTILYSITVIFIGPYILQYIFKFNGNVYKAGHIIGLIMCVFLRGK